MVLEVPVPWSGVPTALASGGGDRWQCGEHMVEQICLHDQPECKEKEEEVGSTVPFEAQPQWLQGFPLAATSEGFHHLLGDQAFNTQTFGRHLSKPCQMSLQF
jgi:hypothetical protein